MLERVIYDVLKTRMDAAIADPTILTNIFQRDGDTKRISDAEMAKIRSVFADPAKAPRIRHGYVRSLADVPCYTLVLSSESVVQHFLADEMAEDRATNDTQIYGTIEDRTYSILVYAMNPDVCYWLFKAMKAFLLGGIRQILIDGKAIGWTYNGAEVEPSPDYLPETIYLRTINLTLTVEEEYEDPASLGKAGDVAPIVRDDIVTGGTQGEVTPTDAGVQ